MRTAPAIELSVGLSRTERALLSGLGAWVAAALAAWGWSHADAAVGLAVLGVWPWVVLLVVAGCAGAAIGWAAARGAAVGTLRWHAGRWTWLEAGAASGRSGTLTPRLDLGGWLLLSFATAGGRTVWITAASCRAAAAWHPLRSVLFSPERMAAQPNPGAGAPES